MKKRIRYLAALLLCVSLLTGCGKETPPEPTEPKPQPTVQVQAPTESTPSEGPAEAPALAFSTRDLTMTKAGETAPVYTGTTPAEEVTFGTLDPAVAVCDNGVITAISRGTTVAYAEYDGDRVECLVNCDIPEETVPITDPRAPVRPAPTVQTVDASFFNDAVFIGDSVSLKLSYDAESTGALGSAQFLVQGSYSMLHAKNDSMLLPYNGQNYKIEDAIAATGAGKVFLMLGMNDIGIASVDATIENWEAVLDRITEKNPDVQIYIQSCTPICTGREVGTLNNSNMDVLNQRLAALAEERSCGFIDVGPYFKDSTNGLAPVYCSDGYVHLTDTGTSVWMKVLKASIAG